MAACFVVSLFNELFRQPGTLRHLQIEHKSDSDIEMILRDKIELKDLINTANRYFPDMIKFCIDMKRRVVCIDEEMHNDMEHVLFDDGSEYVDIYGGNIMIDCDPPEVVWEAHPNIERNRSLGGHGRLLTDERTIDELSEILFEWVK